MSSEKMQETQFKLQKLMRHKWPPTTRAEGRPAKHKTHDFYVNTKREETKLSPKDTRLLNFEEEVESNLHK